MKKLFLLTALSFFAGAIYAAPKTVNGIYVIVNDSVITFQEVEESLRSVEEALYKEYGNQPELYSQKLQRTRAEKVEELVRRELILNDFKKGSYALPESVIDDLVREQIKERYGTRAALMASLQKKFGISFESFRKQIRDDFIVSQMMAMKISSDKIIISPQKVENYYNANAEKFKVADQVKLRMIVLNKTTPQDTAPRKLADEILEKIKAGASFSEMASVYSDSQRSKAGDRGWIERSFFRSEISDVAFSLKAGEHSGVIDLDDACYLLLVEEVRGAHVKPLDELRAEIEATLKSEERARLQAQWIDRLKEKAFIRSF